MRVFQGFDNLPAFVRPVVTVGSYDGVHLGHRELLTTVVELARESGGESVVVTFSPHPREVLDPDGVKLLNLLAEKEMLLERAGVDNLVVVPFSTEFSRVRYDDFVRDYLVGKIGVATFVVGYNHHFGAGKEGAPGSLEALAHELGFGVRTVERHDIAGAKVSSTAIRGHIARGEMKRAAELLGYNYFIKAVMNGEGRVFPDMRNKAFPPVGKYPVVLKCPDGLFSGTLDISDEGMMFVSAHGGQPSDCNDATIIFE